MKAEEQIWTEYPEKLKYSQRWSIIDKQQLIVLNKNYMNLEHREGEEMIPPNFTDSVN